MFLNGVTFFKLSNVELKSLLRPLSVCMHASSRLPHKRGRSWDRYELFAPQFEVVSEEQYPLDYEVQANDPLK
jgi:hypothetical protein